MFKGIMNYLVIGVVAIFGFSSTAFAGEEPIEMLVKFKIEGNPTPAGTYIINGPGYATVTTSNGEILDTVAPGLKIADLSNAEISFDMAAFQGGAPVVNFGCINGGCTITFADGSVLQSYDTGNGDPFSVPLTGRLVTGWGPIMNSDFDYGVTTPMRILGCGGLKEIAGEGKLAGMVGSICFNGVFNVPNFVNNFTLTGGSNCTITMHTPVPMPPQ